MSSHPHRHSHYKHKTVVRNSYTQKNIEAGYHSGSYGKSFMFSMIHVLVIFQYLYHYIFIYECKLCLITEMTDICQQMLSQTLSNVMQIYCMEHLALQIHQNHVDCGNINNKSCMCEITIDGLLLNLTNIKASFRYAWIYNIRYGGYATILMYITGMLIVLSGHD